jgi:nitrogen fixation protein NifQ
MLKNLPKKCMSKRSQGDLIALPSHNADNIDVGHLVGHSIKKDVLTDSFAWVIATYCNPHSDSFVPALGLDFSSFQDLLISRFPHFTPPPDWLSVQAEVVGNRSSLNLFSDLLQLLLDHRAMDDEHHRNIAHLVATACMGGNHLWQDLGLPDRKALSSLLTVHFPTLSVKNTGDMKWKKFFYKQLCESESINICKAPSCAVCSDYAKCFGAEEGDAFFFPSHPT